MQLDTGSPWLAFVQHLPALTPTAYGELMMQAPQCRTAEPPAAPSAPAPAIDRAAGAELAERGQLAMRMHGCHACHSIPGITGPKPQLGPPLAGFASGQLIAGRLANTPDNLVAWIRHPQHIDARTAMPDLGVTQAHAQEMAAYLATLR